MSWKAIAGSIFFVLILLAGSNFVTWKLTTSALRKEFKTSVTKDSSETIIDTVWLKPDTIRIRTASVKKADFNIINEVGFHSADFDTMIVENGDTLAIIKENISFVDGMFELLRDIKIMPPEQSAETEDTINWQTAIIEIPADPPFYNTWIAGFISGVISFVILVIALF